MIHTYTHTHIFVGYTVKVIVIPYNKQLYILSGFTGLLLAFTYSYGLNLSTIFQMFLFIFLFF